MNEVIFEVDATVEIEKAKNLITYAVAKARRDEVLSKHVRRTGESYLLSDTATDMIMQHLAKREGLVMTVVSGGGDTTPYDCEFPAGQYYATESPACEKVSTWGAGRSAFIYWRNTPGCEVADYSHHHRGSNYNRRYQFSPPEYAEY